MYESEVDQESWGADFTPQDLPATTSSCYSPGKGMAVTALTALHLPSESCQPLIQP